MRKYSFFRKKMNREYKFFFFQYIQLNFEFFFWCVSRLIYDNSCLITFHEASFSPGIRLQRSLVYYILSLYIYNDDIYYTSLLNMLFREGYVRVDLINLSNRTMFVFHLTFFMLAGFGRSQKRWGAGRTRESLGTFSNANVSLSPSWSFRVEHSSANFEPS